MAKGKYVSMMIHKKDKMFMGSLLLPTGCNGVLLVFNTKQAAYDFYGEEVELHELTEED